MDKQRFIALDQVRGLAICAMIFAHFGPGLYERIGLAGTILDILQFIGRLATPGFVMIFGFTLAIVYLPKARENPNKTRAILLHRSYLVFLCALLISIPRLLELVYQDFYLNSKSTGMYDYLLSTNSVLMFYTVAIAIVGILIGYISRRSIIFPALIGSISIFVGTLLGYEVWGGHPGEFIELLRLILVSGKYGVLVLLGCALLFVPIGNFIKTENFSDNSIKRVLPVVGIIIILISLSCGRLVGWRNIGDLAQSFGAPPQIWYLSLIGGILCLLISFFASVKIPFISKFLAYTGQIPLRIYVAHKFVLPFVALLKSDFVQFNQAASIIIPLSIFIAFWLFCVFRKEYITNKVSGTQ